MQGPANADDLESYLKELPLASESLDSRGLYIYDDGLRFIIWLGRILSPDIANDLVGVNISGFVDLSKVCIYFLAVSCSAFKIKTASNFTDVGQKKKGKEKFLVLEVNSFA